MNRRSIRFRLTVWYLLAYLVSSAVVFSSFFLVTKRTLLFQTDLAIRRHSETLVELVASQLASENWEKSCSDLIGRQFSEMPGMLVVIANEKGTIVGSSQAGAENNEVIRGLIKANDVSQETIFVERRIGSTALRIGIFPVLKGENKLGMVIMGDPIDAMNDSLGSLLLTLVVVYLVFVPLVVLGSYLLAGSALFPISKMSAEIKLITEGDLRRRVVVKESGDEVSELGETFNALMRRLNDAFERERRFIGDVAHELKTPLATLRGEIELALSRKRSNREYDEVLREILTDTDRLTSIVRDVLDLAWIGAGKSFEKPMRFNLSELLIELTTLIDKIGAKKRIKVTSHIAKDVWVDGSEKKISRAFLNVLDNAVKYTDEGKKIEITLNVKNGFAVVKIADTGRGIPKNELPHVFDRFYRGLRTDGVAGSGLGLSITKEIIESHGGSISIKSKLGHGTTVFIKYLVSLV